MALDHIGFGLSSRSTRHEDYHPAAHAKRFAALLEHLDVGDATLFLTNWGGPIVLAFARRHPDQIARLVLANTWCWPVSGDRHFRMFSFMMRSWVGQVLIGRLNFFVNQVMPRAVGDRAVLTPEVMPHYRNAQPPGTRAACAALPGHIVGASDWLGSIWDDQATFAGKPALALWALRDIAFWRQELERWQSALANVEAHEFEDCRHFLGEEAPDEILHLLRNFMRRA